MNKAINAQMPQLTSWHVATNWKQGHVCGIQLMPCRGVRDPDTPMSFKIIYENQYILDTRFILDKTSSFSLQITTYECFSGINGDLYQITKYFHFSWEIRFA